MGWMKRIFTGNTICLLNPSCQETLGFMHKQIPQTISKIPRYTLWLFNIAMENCPSIDGLPIKNGDFPWLR